MRQIIGVGETILDIIFKNNQPSHAIPGGSVFNTMISLGRLNVPANFISEIGDDRIGKMIMEYMEENHLSTENMNLFGRGKSPVSLAFLDDNNEASYLFYTDFPDNRLDVRYPRINENDIFVFGSYFAVNPLLRERMVELLEYAKERKAIIYYDPNFRKAHAHEAMKIIPSVLENLEYADIVKGSSEDFENLFHLSDATRIYRDKIEFYCPNFIYTQGCGPVNLFTRTIRESFDCRPVKVVSSIGAGDSFNAGILFGLLTHEVTHENLPNLAPETWEKIIGHGMTLSAQVCQTYENAVPQDFARRYIQEITD